MLNASIAGEETDTHWYALKAYRTADAERYLEKEDIEYYLPKEVYRRADGKNAVRPVIAGLVFIRTSEERALQLEKESRATASTHPLYIYRNVARDRIQEISPMEMQLMMLLTEIDTDRQCEVYRKEDFRKGDRVRVIGGPFIGYEGYVRRIRTNRHVVVEISGVCAVALPYIHPDLLEKL